MTTIIGAKLGNRYETAPEFQKTLTNFGCIIKTRLGLHDVSDHVCSPNGIILLEVIDDEEAKKFIEELRKIPGIDIQIMHFPQNS